MKLGMGHPKIQMIDKYKEIIHLKDPFPSRDITACLLIRLLNTQETASPFESPVPPMAIVHITQVKGLSEIKPHILRHRQLPSPTTTSPCSSRSKEACLQSTWSHIAEATYCRDSNIQEYGVTAHLWPSYGWLNTHVHTVLQKEDIAGLTSHWKK